MRVCVWYSSGNANAIARAPTPSLLCRSRPALASIKRLQPPHTHGVHGVRETDGRVRERRGHGACRRRTRQATIHAMLAHAHPPLPYAHTPTSTRPLPSHLHPLSTLSCLRSLSALPHLLTRSHAPLPPRSHRAHTRRPLRPATAAPPGLPHDVDVALSGGIHQRRPLYGGAEGL